MSEGSTEASLRGRMLYPDSIDHTVREDNRGLMDVDVDALSLFCRMIGLASISMDEDKDGTSQNKTTQRKTKVPEKTTKKRIQKRTTDKRERDSTFSPKTILLLSATQPILLLDSFGACLQIYTLHLGRRGRTFISIHLCSLHHYLINIQL